MFLNIFHLPFFTLFFLLSTPFHLFSYTKKNGPAKEKNTEQKRESKRAQLEKTRRDRRKKAYASGRYEAMYDLPSWPYRSLPQRETHAFYTSFNYRCASKAYNGESDTRSVSVLPFGEECTQWQTIFAQSRLLKGDKLESIVNPDQNNPFYYLAEVPVHFKGSIEEIDFSFDYVQHIFNKHFSFGLHLPFSYKRYKCDPSFCLSEEITTKIGNVGDPIHDLYGGSVKNFYYALLCERGIKAERKESVRGLGDTIISLQWEPYCKNFAYTTLTLSLIIPTAKQRNILGLWTPDLGNGGFHGIELAGAALLECHRMFNPHVYVAPRFYFPAKVLRKSIRSISYTAGSKDEICGLSGEYLKYNANTTFSDYETGFPLFGGGLDYVDCTRGFDLSIKIGNVFQKCFVRSGYADLYYHLTIKNKDDISSCRRCLVATPEMGHTTSHVIGGLYSLHIDEKVWLRAGISYTVAGKIAPRFLEVLATIAAEF